MPDQTMGFSINDGSTTLTVGFKQGRFALWYGTGNGHQARAWSISNTLGGVDYHNIEVLPNVLMQEGTLKRDEFKARLELQGTYINFYVDGILAFAGDYVEIMTAAGDCKDKNVKTLNLSSIKFGFSANHEGFVYSTYYACENLKISLVDIASDLTAAKAAAIAKINAVDVEKLSPAGKELFNNKASVIESINAYTMNGDVSYAENVGAIEKIANGVLVADMDYEVFVAGYGNITVKWGTTVASILEGKTAPKSFGDEYGYFESAEGKFGLCYVKKADATTDRRAIAEGELVKCDMRIYPATAKLYSSNEIVYTAGGKAKDGLLIGNGAHYYTYSTFDSGKGVTVRATFDSWAKGTDADKVQGLGFVFRQVSTGKKFSIVTDYKTSGFYLCTADSNGWGSREALPAAKVAPIDKTLSTNKAQGAAIFDMQMKLVGNKVMVWVGAQGATFDDSNVNYVIDDVYKYYTTDKSEGGGAGTLWSEGFKAGPKDATEALTKNMPDFVTDGGEVNVAISFFGDGSVGGYWGNTILCKTTNFNITQH